MAFGMSDVFVAEPLPQQGANWQTTPAFQIENESQKKKLFGVELAKNHTNAFEAALVAFEGNTQLALWATNNWLHDPEVIGSKDLYASTLGVQSKLLDKQQTALKLLQIAEEKLHGRYLVEAKDRLKAIELYAKICGYLNDTIIDNSKNTITNNEIKIVLVKPQEKEVSKTIDVTPTPVEVSTPVNIKLVKSSAA